MSAGRFSGVKRSAFMTTAVSSAATSSKSRRVVNGGGGGVVDVCVSAVGCVNGAEATPDGGNEMAVASASQPVNEELDVARAFARSNILLIQSLNNQCTTFKNIIDEKESTIEKLTQEICLYKEVMANKNQQLAEAKQALKEPEKSVQTPSICSSKVDNSNKVELPPEQHSAMTKKRRSRTVVNKPNAVPLENIQTKNRRTRSAQNKSCDVGKIPEVSLMMKDEPYYTCSGDYNTDKDDPIPGIIDSELEIPSWRLKPFTSWYSMEGTENMSDDIFENRHLRLELCERKRKRWDLQRLRELKRIEYLKEGRNKNQSQNDKEKEMSTLLPNPANLKAIEITDKVPACAFGANMYEKKNFSFKLFDDPNFHQDGSQVPSEPKKKELRSSGRNP